LLPDDPRFDVAALAIVPPESCKLYPIPLSLSETKIPAQPSDPVSIVGFPEGYSAFGKFPIWKTGHIATDITLDAGLLPCFMIDATTRPGMSGSPVIASRKGSFMDENGGITGVPSGGVNVRFLGVYAGRLSPLIDMHIGRVWKPSVVAALVLKAHALESEWRSKADKP
jgi:hypothetical protein